jgi:tagatose-6-phosphate ketose/aldose isomerase
MSSFTRLVAQSENEIGGSFHTAREIAQQPAVWEKVLDLLESRAPEIRAFLRASGAAGPREATILLAGAGSSDYIGRAVAGSLRLRLHREVAAIPTTHLVTHPVTSLSPGRSYLIIHFARSGDSPESLAAYRFVKRARPDARHIVITCNAFGALHQEAREDAATLLITLPEETNDRSLAMTSSFTSMALCAVGLAWLDDVPGLRRHMEIVGSAAKRVMEESADALQEFSERGFSRACYLGSDTLEGAMNEGALKMMEMTAGRIFTASNSFLGIRHGPQVIINSQCAVIACLSSAPAVRRYETDLLRELRRKEQGGGILAISVSADAALNGLADVVIPLVTNAAVIPDELRLFTDLVVCQLLAFMKSRSYGLMPDNPSPGGVINRVVQGVVIYDP